MNPTHVNTEEEPAVPDRPAPRPAGSTRPGGATGGVLPWISRILNIGPTLILIVVAGVMAVVAPDFLTEANLQNVGVQAAVVATLAMGELLVVLVRGVDISVAAVVALGAVVGVAVAGDPTSPLVLIVAALATGAVVGTVNGVAVTWGRIPQPLVVTLASGGIAGGIALLMTNGEIKTGVPSIVVSAGSGFAGPIPIPVILVGAVALLLWGATTQTKWGRWLYAVGDNPEAARRIGIPVSGVVISAYAISGLLAGLGSILMAGRTASIAPQTDYNLLLIPITAIVVGGASLFGGRGTVFGVLAGALTLTVITNGLDLLSVSPYYQAIVFGVLIVVALELDVIRGYVETRMRVVRSIRSETG